MFSSFFRTVTLVLWKDLTVEFRSREILYTTLFFAASCILVFAFSFVREGRALEDADTELRDLEEKRLESEQRVNTAREAMEAAKLAARHARTER